jgi:hypothetical protein
MDNAASVSTKNFQNNFNESQKINEHDKSYIRRNKQHNFDMGSNHGGIYVTEKGSSFNYKGRPDIPRLSPERIREITETNFEIKY